jgi:GMP synthase-like glutamine amidotransferase
MNAGDGSLRALVLQHEDPTPGGYVNEWLDERGADVDVFRIDVDPRQVDPRRFDMIVSLGSEFAAFDDSIPWLEREKRLFLEAMDTDVPVLGICFGGQLLARVLGGESYRGELSEVGWLPVRTKDPDLVPEGPWFQWHFDTFTPPPGAELIADSPAGPQAFSIGRSLGVQFHPEVTPEIMDLWVAAFPHELEEEGVDPDQLLQETNQRADSTRVTAWRLFDGFLNRIRGSTEPVHGR